MTIESPHVSVTGTSRGLPPIFSAGANDLFVAPQDTLFHVLGTAETGLTNKEASARLERGGANRLRAKDRATGPALLLRQFASPIILILIGAALLSIFLRDVTDSAIILTIVLLSGLLGFSQEYGAATAVAKLSAIVATKVRALRDGAETLVPIEEIVPGDIVLLSAGAIIPADCRLLEAHDLFVNEAALTGETFSAEKTPAALSSATPLAQRRNAVFMGTHVVSGAGKACAIQTGRAAEFGKVCETLRLRPPETEFEHGIRRFGYLLAEVTFLLVLAIFTFNVYFHKPVLDSLLFALALAVGLTPQLLPAIISINLSHGARRMAARKVIVKRLAAIENFGSMNVLCSDKTGTLTEGEVRVQAALDPSGKTSAQVLFYAWLNAAHETGFINPIDRAIREAPVAESNGWEKLDEIPYDFLRKRLSVLVQKDTRPLLVTKGALRETLEISARAQLGDGSFVALDTVLAEVERHWEEFSHEGHRVLGVAYREMAGRTTITRADESEMIFAGFVVLSDPPKPGIRATIDELKQLGITLKVITGDNALIAEHVAREVGLGEARILSGPEMREMSAQALTRRVSEVDVFAEIEPMQKERIILALKKAGHVVGYLGDGINDAPALHAADVGLSVDSAVDVAREAADFVLLEHDLEVLVDGVREGRRTFANTLKYVFIATSANFGNMFSMAGASLFLPFLPLLPKQILLINLLTDFPEMTIAGDNVDPEMVQAPRRWDIGFIRRFMLVFGLISSVFDYLTFGVLFWLHANVAQFRTGWFIESIISAALIVLVVRSRRPFFKSRPSKLLALATVAIVIVTAVTPYLPLAGVLGFQPLPMYFYLVLGLVILGYILTAELAKSLFYRQNNGAQTRSNL
ncbi:MAG: magnesium-translocating P-type ATPase [Chthoniobacterales bacterium]